MKKPFGVIYLVTNLVNGKHYVGQSRSHKKRWSRHKHGSGNLHLDASVQKYGIGNFRFEIVYECDSLWELNIAEIEFIAAFKSTDRRYGYNLDPGGNSRVPSAETLKRMSVSRRKRPPMSQASRLKLSKSLTGLVRSDEAIANYCKGAANRVVSKETCLILSEAQKNSAANATLLVIMHKNNVGRHHTPAVRKQIGDTLRGRKRPPEVGRKIAASRRERFARIKAEKEASL